MSGEWSSQFGGRVQFACERFSSFGVFGTWLSKRGQEHSSYSAAPPPALLTPSADTDVRSALANLDGVESYIRLLGEGGFAWVGLCNVVGIEDPVAIKYFKAESAHVALAQRELGIASTLDHPNLVKFCFPFGDPVKALAFEYCCGGSLDMLIHGSGASWFATLSEDRRLAPMVDVANGMAFLHAAGVIHRDIKPSNVLLSQVVDTEAEIIPTAKLSDFGLSRSLLEAAEGVLTACGSARYMAPEVMESSAYGFPADVYSFGIMMYETASGERPYKVAEVRPVLVARIAAGLRPGMSSINDAGASSFLADMLPRTWSGDIATRLTASELATELNQLNLR